MSVDTTEPKPSLKFLVKCPKLDSGVNIETNDWTWREEPPGFDWKGVCPECGEEHFGFTPNS